MLGSSFTFTGDGTGTFKLVERAKAAGYKTLVLTVDVPEVGAARVNCAMGLRCRSRSAPSQFVDFALHPRWSLTSLAARQARDGELRNGRL